jgi:hypothetical protein
MLGNESRRVVRCGSSRRNKGSVRKAVCGANEVFTTIQGLRDRSSSVLPFGIQFDPRGFVRSAGWVHALGPLLY